MTNTMTLVRDIIISTITLTLNCLVIVLVFWTEQTRSFILKLLLFLLKSVTIN